MKGKSILLGLVLCWMAVTTMARTERADSLGTTTTLADTTITALADTATTVSSDTPVTSVDTIAIAADSITVTTDSIDAVPDSILVVSDSLSITTDSLTLANDSLTLATDSLALANDSLASAINSLIMVPDSITALADSILIVAGSMELPDSIRALADAVGKDIRPMMTKDSTAMIIARVKALANLVSEQAILSRKTRRVVEVALKSGPQMLSKFVSFLSTSFSFYRLSSSVALVGLMIQHFTQFYK